MNPVFETMTRFKSGSITVRVWRECSSWQRGPDEEVVALLSQVIPGTTRTVESFVNVIKHLPRISAIEVLDKHGNGGLFYPDWK